MTNERRLIDANKLSDKIGDMKHEITRNRGGYRYCNEEEKREWDKLDFFDSLVCDAPTVDAVEVVRCKDCRFYEMGVEYYGGGTKDICRLFKRQEREDSFCAHGERRSENATH